MKILEAVGLFVDCGAAAGLVRFGFESRRQDRLRITACVEGRRLVDPLIDPELLGPESPPKTGKNRKGKRNEHPFMPRYPSYWLNGHTMLVAFGIGPLASHKFLE